jgi:hypothetical protein
MSDEVRRRPDGSVILPDAREPFCIHSQGTQPMSACIDCQHSPRLRDWKVQWAAYFADHPNDPRNPNPPVTERTTT